MSTADLIVEPIGLEVETLPRPIHFATLFGTDHPVELEIGMGKGTFLVDQSRRRPDINFIGIEYARFYWRHASDRLRRNNCLNVRTLRVEAAFFLREYISENSLAAVHILFPDPWPKKRHHKRRLIQPPFLAQLVKVLRPAGRIQIVTDYAEYFEQIQSALGAAPGLKVIDYARPDSAADGELAGTNFERKYLREGRPVHAIAAQRV